MKREEALRYRAMIERAATKLDDADALESVGLFPAWKAGLSVSAGERFRHDDELYKCVQAHTTQAGWMPNVTPALWVKVSVDEWPEFVQPTGAHDAYNTGDKVTFEGGRYVSVIDGNIWSPVGYPAGWEKT